MSTYRHRPSLSLLFRSRFADRNQVAKPWQLFYVHHTESAKCWVTGGISLPVVSFAILYVSILNCTSGASSSDSKGDWVGNKIGKGKKKKVLHTKKEKPYGLVSVLYCFLKNFEINWALIGFTHPALKESHQWDSDLLTYAENFWQDLEHRSALDEQIETFKVYLKWKCLRAQVSVFFFASFSLHLKGHESMEMWSYASPW